MSTSPDPLAFQRQSLPCGATLHLNSTTKLKTVIAQAVFTGDLDASVTRKALIPMMLRRGTRRYPDMKAVNRRLEDLYGASLGSDIGKVGEWLTLRFRLETVNDRFLPRQSGLLEEGLRFLHELLHAPRLVGGSFDAEVVGQEKHNLERVIQSLVDDKAQYALERCIQEMCAEEEFRRFELGDIADLPGIDAPALTASYRDWVERYPLDIYLAGDIDMDAAADLVKRIFSGQRPADYQPRPPPDARPVGSVRRIEERMDVNQGKLVLGFRHGTGYLGGDLEGMVMMNGLLGTFPHSKLFQNVREKASLAYDVHSILERSKGLLFVVCGIAVENAERVVDIIDEQIRGLQAGDITEDELVSTRESFLNHLTLMEDSPGELMDVDRVWRMHGREFDLRDYRSRLKAVERDRIAAAAGRLVLDTVYFLRS